MTEQRKHGEVIETGDYSGCRHCDTHGQHGHLYQCKEYNDKTHKAVDHDAMKWYENLRSPVALADMFPISTSDEMVAFTVAANRALAGLETPPEFIQEVLEARKGTPR